MESSRAPQTVLQALQPLTQRPGSRPFGSDLKSMMRAYEKQLIEAALTAAAGHQRRAAKALGLLPTTLHEKMKRLGLAGDSRTAGAQATRSELAHPAFEDRVASRVDKA
jgi:DNA-binding NtrC family response regulator